MKVQQKDGSVSLSVGALIDRLLEDFDMTDCNPKSTPLAPGSVLVLTPDDEILSKEETALYRRGAATITWASVCCRPDLSHAASQLGKVQSKPTKRHMRHLRHVIALIPAAREKAPTRQGEIGKRNIDAKQRR